MSEDLIKNGNLKTCKKWLMAILEIIFLNEIFFKKNITMQQYE